MNDKNKKDIPTASAKPEKMHKFSAVSTEKYASPIKGNGKQTIFLYGEENSYPEFLIKLFKSSATHSAIVTRKRDYTCGAGIKLDELDPSVQEILVKSDIDTLLQNLSLDLEIFGGFAFRVQRNIINDAIIKFEYVDFSKLRQYEDGSLRYADVWKKTRTSATEVRKWEIGGEGPQVYYYTGGVVREAYPDPGYVGAIPSIETDIEVQNFHLNNVKNGFSVPTIINFNNGLPSAEEAEEVEQTIIDKFTGSANAGKFLINYAATKEEAATIEKLANDGYDEKFEVVAKQVQDKILIGHKVINPLLFGVMVPGQLGGRSELLESYELFKATYIETQRQALLGALEAVLAEYYGEVTLQIVDKKPVSEEEALYTKEELREKAGLPFIVESDFSKKLATMTPETQKAVLAFLSKDELFSKLGI